MKITQRSVLDLMGQPGIRFTIPRFQRPYSWTTRQCEELWRDMSHAARDGRAHFLGTIIYLEQNACKESETEASPGEGLPAPSEGLPGRSELAIVDGQQRLATITLLVMALAAHMRERGEGIFGLDAQTIDATYLVAGGACGQGETADAVPANGARTVAGAGATDAIVGAQVMAADGPHPCKLQLSPVDAATLQAIHDESPLPEAPSQHVVENYRFFREKLAQGDVDALEVWRGLDALFIICSQLDDAWQAPAVFESFNSKGMPLTTADLVRNYLLIAENRREQTRLYEKYWEPIAGLFGDDPGSIRLNNAILGWLSVRFRKARRFTSTQAFSLFKRYYEDEYDGTVDALLEELFSFCMVWAENYRYHAVKKYRSADWASLGLKTRVSDRPLAALDHPESAEYYKRHFGVNPKW